MKYAALISFIKCWNDRFWFITHLLRHVYIPVLSLYTGQVRQRYSFYNFLAAHQQATLEHTYFGTFCSIGGYKKNYLSSFLVICADIYIWGGLTDEKTKHSLHWDVILVCLPSINTLIPLVLFCFTYQLYHNVAVLVSLFCEVTWISAVFNIIFANKKHIWKISVHMKNMFAMENNNIFPVCRNKIKCQYFNDWCIRFFTLKSKKSLLYGNKNTPLLQQYANLLNDCSKANTSLKKIRENLGGCLK